jgi:hypothetical protein
MPTIEAFEEELHDKIKVLNETAWESKIKRPIIDKWLNNFKTRKEKSHALYLLSNFMYFGDIQIKQLLISLYRDLYKYPIIQDIRKTNNNTVDLTIIENGFSEAKRRTKFLAIGNSSESGSHLLYIFRQINNLPLSMFGSTDDIFVSNSHGERQLKDPQINHYVLFDDFCGSGKQAITYSKDTVATIKNINPNIKISYLMLFATKAGKQLVLNKTLFDHVEAVVEFDESFQFFNTNSRYLKSCSSHIDKEFLKEICEQYGEPLVRDIGIQLKLSGDKLEKFIKFAILGFGDCQLLIGFSHNTPNNTLPIIWYDEENIVWYPIFKRYNKVYNQ